MGKRAFEQSQYSITDLNNPSDFNFVVGKAGQEERNISKTTFYQWIKDIILTSYAKIDFSNLSSGNKITARTNLSVYSKAEIDALLAGKQDI